jgi:hypothetical protein
MPIQNTIGSTPISNVIPPPEGNLAAALAFVLTPAEASIAANLQLSSQSGLMMSQVITLLIDNTANAYPITVVHGALSETTTVAALSQVIVPTFSNKSSFPINVALSGNVTPSANATINIIFLNYVRQSWSYNNTQQSAIIATGQNTFPIGPQIINVTGTGIFQIAPGPTGSFIFDSLDIALEGYKATAVGLVTGIFTLSCGNVAGTICAFQIVAEAPDLLFHSGAGVWSPIYRTWPQGLVGGPSLAAARQASLFLQCSALSNAVSLLLRVNISGIATL